MVHPTPVRHRVVAYILDDLGRLLLFRHTAFPEAGIQVPGGSVEPGEDVWAAALREAREETGLQNLEVRALLGVRDYDRAQWGLAGIERRYFFHIALHGPAPERWLHEEATPSDGSPGPIEFELYWAPWPQAVPRLAGRQGDLLSELTI